MKNWHRSFPPYEGEEPYLYFAFADADEKKVWNYLRPLLERGCRVWYRFGPAGGAERLLHDQERSSGAALTLLFLTDAACADKDTKSNVLVNQKYGRPILCLDPDGTDRRLRMGLREDVPHVPLYSLRGGGEIEDAVIHAEGFSQDIIGETHASIFDAEAGIALNGHFMKLLAWYDNEYGFTCNMMRLLAHIAEVQA